MNHSELLTVNVNDHTEKKNGLTYLSWAWAWAAVLKADPTATFKVEMYADEKGMVVPYMSLGNSFMVWVTVTVFGKPITCQLPVLDYRNKCVVDPNAFDVNTSIMRCLVKGIALHGLGLYIYAGEDLPMESEPVTIKPTDSSGVPTASVQVDTGEADANAQLFADGMIEYTSHVTNVKGLNSYWNANKDQLDGLKISHPALYTVVLTKFSELKKELSKTQE
jgi:hypothetical protein